MTKKVTDYAVLHIAVIAKRTNVTITDYFSQHTAQHLIMIKYGLPYKGSKNKLAERIVNLLPRASHFYDLFSGGCAVAHCPTNNSKKVIEKIFIPRTQDIKLNSQLNLF